MTTNSYMKAALAQAAFELAPPLIRQTLIEDADFRDEYGFSADAVLTFGSSGVSVQRSFLLDAIRDLFSSRRECIIADTEGRSWTLEILNDGELPRFALSRVKQRLVLPDFCALSPDPGVRLAQLNESSSEVNLPQEDREKWQTILRDRPLEDEEVDPYHRDFQDTPLSVAQTIRNEVAAGESSITSLVPQSRRYYDRLIGAYDGSNTVQEFAKSSGAAHFKRLSGWRPYDGLLFALFNSAHSSMTAEIDAAKLDKTEIVRAFDYLIERGDRISQVGAIEVGLRILPTFPAIEGKLSILTKLIRDDEPERDESDFKLLAALFLLADGELARIRLFPSEPPFYRRLAALSQAALIHRQLIGTAVDYAQFCEWAFTQRSAYFYFQSLADMRSEPRWHPDLSTAAQIRADLIGRIMLAARHHEMNINSSEFSGLALSDGKGSLQEQSDFIRPYLPGPLEGSHDSPNVLPSEIAETIESRLAAAEVEPESFIPLVNSALLFRVSAGQAELAAKALKLGSYRLANVADKSQLLAVLDGLATVAAATRSPVLADELRVLVRRYRHDTQYPLTMREAIWMCLVAAASREGLEDWRSFVGEWLTELAFGELQADEAEILYSQLHCLCQIVPELWVSCGRADAALHAYRDR